ncbi:MAG: transposase [Rubrobacter sp.]|nr:transposase [Rubrobacter sp.]
MARPTHSVSVHKSHSVRELIEAQGCELWFLPPYSPDLNPIQEAFSKAKGSLREAKARTLQTLFEATAKALRAWFVQGMPAASSGTASTSCRELADYEKRVPPDQRDWGTVAVVVLAILTRW